MEYQPHDNAELIREQKTKLGDIQVYELTPDDGPIRKHRFYVVRWTGNQVQSAVSTDMATNGTWVHNGCAAEAISYVAGGRTRKNAMHHFRDLTRNAE